MHVVFFGIGGRGGSRRGFIFIPEEMEGNRWRRMAEVLWDFVDEGRGSIQNRGAFIRPSMAVLQPHAYKETLIPSREPLPPWKWKRGSNNGGLAAQRGANSKSTFGHGTDNCSEGGGWRWQDYCWCQ